MTQPGSEVGGSAISLLGAGQGRVAEAFGDRIVFLVDGERSSGAMTQWISHVPPGGGPPPHMHANEDEAFYVLSGAVSFLDGASGTWTELTVGASAFMPRGTFHSFKNTGSEPATLLVTTTPSGFETFFTRCAEVFAQPGPPDMARILAIGAEHGMKFVVPGGE